MGGGGGVVGALCDGPNHWPKGSALCTDTCGL